jgi:capsular exopolysaccharide synthesis family protein
VQGAAPNYLCIRMIAEKSMKKSRKLQSVISLYDKESSAATELRRIYDSLRARRDNGDLHSLLVTSSTIGEGKSITCSFLAVTAAAVSKSKIALIDLDLRRPKIHEYFSMENKSGIGDVLLGKSSIKDVARKTPIPELTIITSGNISASPSDVLDQANIPGLLQELKYQFDFVIIDSPPVIPVSDPMMFVDRVDGVLMVVRAGTTQKEVVNRAVRLLSTSTVNLIGIVLNDYESVLPYYYKDHYYGYRYASRRQK